MNDIKGYALLLIGSVMTMINPIKDYLSAIFCVMVLDFIFGLIAGIFQGEKWNWKKAGRFFLYAALFMVLGVSIQLTGTWMHNEMEAKILVKFVFYAAIYFFSTKIIRNFRDITIKGSTWYRTLDFLYYVLTVQFVEKLKYYKEYQKAREAEGNKEQNPQQGQGSRQGDRRKYNRKGRRRNGDTDRRSI